MDVLYITAACLTKNTSANMSHNGYVQGLIENGADVEIIMSDDSFGSADNKLKRWGGVKYNVYPSHSFMDKIRIRLRTLFPPVNVVKKDFVIKNDSADQKKNSKHSVLYAFRERIKRMYFTIFKQDSLYPLDAVWLKNASCYESSKEFDLIISNSSPAASHKLVSILKEKKRIKYKRWIQIWEDPWSHDLYGNHSNSIFEEEQAILSDAEEIYYVSPLTLFYQKKYFPNSTAKMKFIPLPFMKLGKDEDEKIDKISFGYFGDYYSKTRNLQPFYEALIERDAYGSIYGDTDLCLKETEKVEVKGRVTLDILEKVQDETSVLVHLCNLRGGQIPGKIYHYSATTKPILFILDGTIEEQNIIEQFFSKFNRYYFCKNNKDDIANSICELSSHYEQYKGFVVQDFAPKNIVSQLLK